MSHQPDITAAMRTILVDWLIEVQENFELFHETLYLAVKLADLYLMKREVKREYLQLVGATCMLIAAKFEVLMYMLDQPCSQEHLAFVTSIPPRGLHLDPFCTLWSTLCIKVTLVYV